jgi:hypothetical protein
MDHKLRPQYKASYHHHRDRDSNEDDPLLTAMTSVTMTSHETSDGNGDTTNDSLYYSASAEDNHSRNKRAIAVVGQQVNTLNSRAVNNKGNNSQLLYNKHHPKKKRGSMSSKITRALFRERRSSHIKMVSLLNRI